MRPRNARDKVTDMAGNRTKRLLKNVRSVILTEPCAAAPLVNQWPIEVHHLAPCILIVGPDATQESH